MDAWQTILTNRHEWWRMRRQSLRWGYSHTWRGSFLLSSLASPSSFAYLISLRLPFASNIDIDPTSTNLPPSKNQIAYFEICDLKLEMPKAKVGTSCTLMIAVCSAERKDRDWMTISIVSGNERASGESLSNLIVPQRV